MVDQQVEVVQQRVVVVETENRGCILKTTWTDISGPSRMTQLALLTSFLTLLTGS